MTRLLFIVAFVGLCIVVSTLADVEYEDHGHDHHHHHSHDGHDHHDHESHKKLFTGDDADGTQDEQHEKLRTITSKIDTNRDGRVTRDEMRTYVEERIKEQQKREFDDLTSTLDPAKANKITYAAYVRDNYGDLDTGDLENIYKNDPHSREMRRTFIADKEKWTHLDKDGDKSLTYEEFQRFTRPEDNEDLRRIEINSMINEYDDDKDGKVSNEEYGRLTEAETGQSELLTEELDTNKDGFAEYEEFARYYLPTSSMTLDEETDHLMKECDRDKNGECSPDEIVNAYSSFAGSQITDFGADLETHTEDL